MSVDARRDPRPPAPLLAVDALTTILPTRGGALHAVDGVSFTLGAGEVLGVVGESGSGKTMLARTVMGLAPPAARTSGSVRFAGRNLLDARPRDLREVLGPGLAMVFQDPATALNPVTRIGRQLVESLRLRRGLDRRAARDQAVGLLARVGIPDPERRAASYPHELSGGMRQRVSIALAVACGPRVLLADEPTTALDVTVQRQILDLLADLQRGEGMGMLLITHDLAVVAERTERLMVMYAGQIVESGPTPAVVRAPRHPYTAALLASTPRLDRPIHARLDTVPGQPAIPVDPAAGCRFAPRCPRAQPRCRRESPRPTTVTGPITLASDAAAPTRAHTVACFHPTPPATPDAIPTATLTATLTATPGATPIATPTATPTAAGTPGAPDPGGLHGQPVRVPPPAGRLDAGGDAP
ncbi:ABC transporter ATP-binding protein [Frankia sp. AiPs1]|uniref:ABC transporter ATP-binding protein n=1 Tax=Frankia sp. AiPs1 TaxID=573493 RepID=UPI002042DB02|nr:ABC transporter ATP-binding protein [Frankia sp. AiPs1]MCM3924320.1 ABC transporter ATP-binding protein [Frankia sp. AiPs1]